MISSKTLIIILLLSDAFLSMRIAPILAPDNKTETFPRKRVTVLCDFRGKARELG